MTAFLLANCSIVPGSKPVVNVEEGTLTPTPTKDPSGFQAIAPEACQVADWAAMQTNKPQGDLIAWQPGTINVAYLAPADRSSWYIGTLMLAKGPDYKERKVLASGILATGDLTWSPGGSMLAFLAYLPNENAYTVMTVHPDGSQLTDLFPTDLARTDSRTSQKSILGWKNEKVLQVMASCGEECRQAYDIDLSTGGTPVLIPTPIANYRELVDSLQIHRKTLAITPEAFPKIVSTPSAKTNWSPNQSMASYLDKRGILWLLNVEGKTNYLLDIGLRDVNETQWADNNQYLAIRAEDRIFIFQIPCGKPVK